MAKKKKGRSSGRSRGLLVVQIILVMAVIGAFIAVGITWNNTWFDNFANWKRESPLNDTHFLHISKNGGTSIKSLSNQIFDISSHDYTANDLYGKGFVAIIRDPVDRFVSAFNFVKRGGFNPEAETFKTHPIHSYRTVNQFLDGLRKGDPRAVGALKTGDSGVPVDVASVVYWPQNHWLRSEVNKKLTLMDFDRLNELFKKRFGIDLPMNNKTKEKVSTDVSPENVDFLMKIYAPDFKLYKKVKSEGIFETDTDTIMKLGDSDVLVTPEKYIRV